MRGWWTNSTLRTFCSPNTNQRDIPSGEGGAINHPSDPFVYWHVTRRPLPYQVHRPPLAPDRNLRKANLFTLSYNWILNKAFTLQIMEDIIYHCIRIVSGVQKGSSGEGDRELRCDLLSRVAEIAYYSRGVHGWFNRWEIHYS